MQTSSLLKAFKLAPNRQSNWTRHLNQSKSIRLRQRRAASTEPSPIGSDKQPLEQQQQQKQALAGGDLGRVSINHVGVDYDESQLNEQRGQLPAATTSGTQLPMISPEEESKSHCSGHRNSQQKKHHLRKSHLIDDVDEPTKSMLVERNALHQSGGSCWRPSPAAVMLASVMVASIVCAPNLIGPCNCDTLKGHSPFAASRAAVQQQVAGGPSHGAGSNAAQPLRSSAHAIIERRHDELSRDNTDKLLSSMAARIERQHLGGEKSANFRPVSTQRAKAAGNQDDFLRDILASHERGRARAKSGSSNSNSERQTSPPAGSSKADLKLRQIMLMHEHALPPAGVSKSQSAESTTTNSDNGSSKAAKWPAAIKSILPKQLLASSKASLMSIVPTQILSGRSQALFMKAAGSSGAEATQLDQHGDASSPSVVKSPFTQRASAKNYLMGSILGMGQMLMTQPKRFAATKPNRPQKATDEKMTIYSKPANEFKSLPMSNEPKNHKSSWPRASSSQADKPKAELEPVATNSNSEQTNAQKATTDSSESSSGPTGWRQSSSEATKQKVSAKKNWLVDDATNLAQAYIKDSFRDLLTLTQLPIFSGGPVSTAPSELEPGGKKWLANQMANEQIRGNKTNTIEDLLRYLYILSNVGVRRKRDPLKALGSHSHPSPLSALTNKATKPIKRPHLSLLASAAAAAASAKRPTISSLIKFHPPNKIAASKLSSLLAANRDHIKSRGVMWDMATDTTLAVTMFHLLERASVALPLGFLLMPFVRMTRHPLGGFDLGSILPAKASHRSVDLEELAKRLDMDKILSRSMRSTHRNTPSFMS